jgi:signal transduction histidine kinase
MFEEQNEIKIVVIIGTTLILFLGCILIFIAFLYQKKKQRHFKETQLIQSQFQQELLRTQLEIQEQTLKTISEEIHDNVGQVLSLAKLNLNTFENNSEQKLHDTKQLISKAINDLRDLSRSMHGDRIAELGLHQSIADELQILQNSGEFETHLQITGETYKLLPQKEMVLFRMVQEALNNAIKHARAKNISLQLHYKPEMFTLTVQDDGTGFDTTVMQNKNGIGLKSMQNRAALIGGSFTVYSKPGNGTVISIELPTS